MVRGNDGWLGPFTVDYQTVDGTAQAGVDYQAASGTLTFGTNEMVKSIPVVLLQNPAPETAKYFHGDPDQSDGADPYGPEFLPRHHRGCCTRECGPGAANGAGRDRGKTAA